MPALIEGHCALCAEFGELSKDHVPPKGSAQLSRVRIGQLADDMGVSSGSRPVLGETGVRFRTLCLYCNNTRLGRWYDPELKRISEQATRVLSAASILALPARVVVTVKAQRVARAVIGHLLAAVPPEMAGKMPLDGTRALRDYFLDPDAPLPDGVSIYYWTYPSLRLVIARAVAKVTFDSRPPLLGDILKFYPLGYWVVWKGRPLRTGGLSLLLANRALDIDSEEDLPIGFHNQPALDFPEAPEGVEVTMMNDRLGVTAKPRLTTRQLRGPNEADS